jgi:hypothetical protein
VAKQQKDPQDGSTRPAPGAPTPSDGDGPGGKGHPTPKRRAAQAANKRPLVPTDRKAAAKASREKQRQDRARVQQAMASGDERYFPARDKGPVRRYIRDYVDARWNLAEFFLPASLVIVGAVLLGGSRAQLAIGAILALYLLIAVALADTIVAILRLRKRIRAKFGEVPKGTSTYAAIRAFQLRPTRMPRAMVKRGEYPA